MEYRPNKNTSNIMKSRSHSREVTKWRGSKERRRGNLDGVWQLTENKTL
jgi:hypothetical protein